MAMRMLSNRGSIAASGFGISGNQTKRGSDVFKERDLQNGLAPASNHIAGAADCRRAEVRWTANASRHGTESSRGWPIWTGLAEDQVIQRSLGAVG